MSEPDFHRADNEQLSNIRDAILEAIPPGSSLRETVAPLIRKAIDEVIDSPRTGRLRLEECEKTEKTYLGTKIEILIRSALGFPKGSILDVSINGVEVDIKHTIGNSWMIPKEAIDKVCILIRESEPAATFDLGLIVCRFENLRIGENRDSKLGISADGLKRVLWLARGERYPRNIWLDFDRQALDRIASRGGGSARLAELFRSYVGRPVPRSAVEAVARQLDPMKRLRNNGGARSILQMEGIAILSGKYHRDVAVALGLPLLFADEFVSFRPTTDAELSMLRSAGLI